MEVTNDNFEEAFPVIEKAIRRCDFMSMDFELTGLFPRSAPASSHLDTLQERYERFCLGPKTFIPIQFGLCTVYWNSEKGVYEAESFNFYIHPMVGKKGYQFCCDLSSLKFLSSNEFDFNKLFAKGIQFTSQEKQNFFEEQNQEPLVRDKLVPNADGEKFLNTTLETLERWLQTTEVSLELPACNSYFMRILYQEIPLRYPNLLLSSESVEGQRYWKSMKIQRFGEEERKKMKEEKAQLAEEVKQEKFKKTAGFRRVIDVMVDVQKPLLGHNMMLDICYFYQYFIGTLPDDVGEFKKNFKSRFPFIIDTKFLASDIGADSTALGDLYAHHSKTEKPIIELKKGSSEEDKAHEAGWDAYMTAHIFLKLCGVLHENIEHPIAFSEQSPIYNLWNTIFLARMSCNLELLCDQSNEKAPKNVFHVFNFASQVKTSDIISWFKGFGSVSVNWKDDNSAFVTVDQEKLDAVLLWSQTSQDKFEIETLQNLRDRNKRERSGVASTPPREPLVDPPARVRRSSLKHTSGKKRPRPSSIGFDEETSTTNTKRSKKRRSSSISSTPAKTFECCIS